MPCRVALFTPILATQPELTAFARAQGVRRVESRHRERHAGSVRGSARDEGVVEGAALFRVDRNLATGGVAAHALLLALFWPVCACAVSPVHDCWTCPYLLCEIRVLVCVMVCRSLVIRIATL